MFFDDWTGLLRVILVGVAAYLALVVLLRLSGKRTLAKMNAFDLVVTVALGSTLATVLLSQQTALAEGAAGFVVLAGMQFLVAWLSVRSRLVNRLAKSRPRMLLYEGVFRDRAMLQERVAAAEVLQAVRSAGYASLGQVLAVVLETDGTFSVIGRLAGEGDGSALVDVDRD